MFENMNPLDRPTAWLEIFILMFGAFLIGYIFARSYYKRKRTKDLEKIQARLTRLQTGINSAEKPSFYIDEPGRIKAIKTRERAGVAVERQEQKEPNDSDKQMTDTDFDLESISALDFKKIGTGSLSEKDDFRKIAGVGLAIEQKLNNIGIYKFEQISRFETEDIKTVTKLINLFPGRIERDNWINQAHDLKEKK